MCYYSTTAANRCLENAALDYANSLGLCLPTHGGLLAFSVNQELVANLRTYMNSVEGRSIPTLPTGAC